MRGGGEKGRAGRSLMKRLIRVGREVKNDVVDDLIVSPDTSHDERR